MNAWKSKESTYIKGEATLPEGWVPVDKSESEYVNFLYKQVQEIYMHLVDARNAYDAEWSQLVPTMQKQRDKLKELFDWLRDKRDLKYRCIAPSKLQNLFNNPEDYLDLYPVKPGWLYNLELPPDSKMTEPVKREYYKKLVGPFEYNGVGLDMFELESQLLEWLAGLPSKGLHWPKLEWSEQLRDLQRRQAIDDQHRADGTLIEDK